MELLFCLNIHIFLILNFKLFFLLTHARFFHFFFSSRGLIELTLHLRHYLNLLILFVVQNSREDLTPQGTIV